MTKNRPVEKLAVLVTMCLETLGFRIDSRHSDTIAQAIGFGVVGLSNTLVSYLLYVGALWVLRRLGWLLHADYLVAQVISFVLSVAWSYWWNSRFVFGERGLRALVRTYISYSFTGLFLSAALLVFWVQVLSVSEYLAPILNLLFTVPLNFVLNKFWAFKKRDR